MPKRSVGILLHVAGPLESPNLPGILHILVSAPMAEPARSPTANGVGWA
jgi:hypothetical protein